MDSSQMHSPPPTRDASSQRRHSQYAVAGFKTPVTVVARNTYQAPPSENSFTQTPFAFQSLQFSPDTAQFPNTEPLTAPALPQSRLFWGQSDMNSMDVDIPLASDPFGPTPHKIEAHSNWPAFGTSTSQVNPLGSQALYGMSSPGNCTSFATKFAPSSDMPQHKPSHFLSTSASVDPSMLFSFSSPGPSAHFAKGVQPPSEPSGRQPYQTQFDDSRRERERQRELAKTVRAQHSRTSTSSSNASFDNTRPGLQRRLTDGGYRKRPSSMESQSSGSATGLDIPRRLSPLKRQSGSSLTSIPETRRQVTRLVIDPDGRARTETAPVEDESVKRRNTNVRDPHHELRRQYPALYAVHDSDSDTDEEPVILSRNSSFTLPPRRSKQTRAESGSLDRSNSLKVAKASFGYSDTSSFETLRPRKNSSEDSFPRFSMDFPSSLGEIHERQPPPVPDSPGDALGALKKVVGERQKRIEHSVQNTLKVHNQRWAQASADLHSGSSPRGQFDPFNNSFSASPATNTEAGFTTPSTDRSSLSMESIRCVCNSTDDSHPMVQCESCNKWLHVACVGFNSQHPPPVYVCSFCTGLTPLARGGRVRGPMLGFDSPLTRKSVFRQ